MPNFAEVYRFIGSVFDPNTSGHLHRLKQMDPINMETYVKHILEKATKDLERARDTHSLEIEVEFSLDEQTHWFVQARPNIVESTNGSHDLQMVKIGLKVLTRPMGDRLPHIFQTLGDNYSERLLPSIIHETLKAIVAQYIASELITQRETVSREIRKILTERASNFDMMSPSLRSHLAKKFTAAIEAKQVAAQEAERAKFIVEKAEQDKRSVVIRAQVIDC
ncbi:unnamed protein product [Eruca vesicaria subsp. sativa]|uniref:Prohibitin n=1 Tax=Eruca vesicaria subsp. sativa TaxID=29727 RepID=A0ABC8K4G3_ERUVS|nr:unnamed protein product [Eruca vesicaria subsp. sativa]